MAACRVVHSAVSSAIDEIGKIGADYQTQGGDFVSALKSAIADMEGASKDSLLTFIEKTVEPFVSESLPQLVQGMSELLKANLDNFVSVDDQIAASISG